jgi:uncharacterized protein YjbI with pentapeptide repeats
MPVLIKNLRHYFITNTFIKITKMRIYLKALAIAFILPLACIAQKSITAASVIQSINNGQPVSLNGAEITGDLDLTRLNNMKLEQQNSSDKSYRSTVTVALGFVNCTFTGKVLGFFSPDEYKPYVKSHTVYNADFDEDVSFANCIFEKEATFKYSTFNKKISFTKSRFDDDAVFKYTTFKEGPDFSHAAFKTDADFKYVDFPGNFDFGNAVFESGADFKYTQFKNGGSFMNTMFKSGTDFKYAAFSRSVNMQGANFSGENDFKYTTLDGQKTTPDELVNK